MTLPPGCVLRRVSVGCVTLARRLSGASFFSPAKLKSRGPVIWGYLKDSRDVYGTQRMVAIPQTAAMINILNEKTPVCEATQLCPPSCGQCLGHLPPSTSLSSGRRGCLVTLSKCDSLHSKIHVNDSAFFVVVAFQ